MRLDEAFRVLDWTLGGKAPSQDDQLVIVNDAGEWFCGAHQWNFLNRGPLPLDARATITLTAATWTPASFSLSQTGAFAAYNPIPGDIIQITGGTGITLGSVPVAGKVTGNNNAIVLAKSIGIAGASNVTATMKLYGVQLPADIAHIPPGAPTQAPGTGFILKPADGVELDMALVGPTPQGNYAYIWTTEWPQPYDITVFPPIQNGEGVMRMAIWPEIPTGQLGAFSLRYRAKWLPITTDSNIINMPKYTNPAFREALRCYARGYEEEDEGSVSDRIANLVAGPLWMQAVNQDSYTQSDLGAVRGSAVLDAMGIGQQALQQFDIQLPS